MSCQKLIEMMENFTPGNLIEQVDIVEKIKTLLNEKNIGNKEKEVLTHVSQNFNFL